MRQKILKKDGEAIVIIPKQYLKILGLSAGDEVKVEFDREKQVIIISSAKNDWK